MFLWWQLVAALVMVAASPGQDAREDPLQDLDEDLDRLLDDDRLFQEYYRCLLDQGPCNQDTTKFKDVIQEALERECARCSQAQRHDAIHLLRLLMECRPMQYAEIERQYDPSGAFQRKYRAGGSRRQGVAPGVALV